MGQPLVSVILPTYNGSKYIASAIRSVLSQRYKNIEFIVINDASTDFGKTEKIILSFEKEDARLVYVKNEVNLERSASKNKGIRMAKWEYIAFIDDDDIWQDAIKIEKQVNCLLKNPSLGMIGTCAETIDENGLVTGNISVQSDDISIRSRFLVTNQFIQSAVLVRKDLLEKIGGFDESMNLCEDYDVWLRIGAFAQFENLADKSILYMVRNTNTSSKNMWRMKIISLKLMWKYRKLYPNLLIAIILRAVTFIIPLSLIVRVRKYL